MNLPWQVIITLLLVFNYEFTPLTFHSSSLPQQFPFMHSFHLFQEDSSFKAQCITWYNCQFRVFKTIAWDSTSSPLFTNYLLKSIIWIECLHFYYSHTLIYNQSVIYWGWHQDYSIVFQSTTIEQCTERWAINQQIIRMAAIVTNKQHTDYMWWQ